MNLDQFKVALGKRIATVRKEKEMTQPELGALLGKDFQSISRIENGKVNISAHLLYQIAKALGVEPKGLLNFD